VSIDRSNLLQSLPRLTQLDDDLLNIDDDSSVDENEADDTDLGQVDAGSINGRTLLLSYSCIPHEPSRLCVLVLMAATDPSV